LSVKSQLSDLIDVVTTNEFPEIEVDEKTVNDAIAGAQ